jgi:acetyl esterase/lipase
VCISANYRLGQAGRFPNSLIDAKRVVCWARSHAAEYGADPSILIVAGSSAGAHLASMAALTPNNPAFQPGFEEADTSVTAAVCLYGYYGEREVPGPLQSSPEAYVSYYAPPFLIAHGDNDTLISPAHADHFVRRLRTCSTGPVVFLQLLGAEHSFDLFHSLRFDEGHRRDRGLHRLGSRQPSPHTKCQRTVANAALRRPEGRRRRTC